MSTQTPAQIAEAALPVYIGDSDTSDGFDQDDLLSFAAAAIEADRAQPRYLLVSDHDDAGVIGMYYSREEAVEAATANCDEKRAIRVMRDLARRALPECYKGQRGPHHHGRTGALMGTEKPYRIATDCTTRADSNVGSILARTHGAIRPKRLTRRIDQSASSDANHEAAALALAVKIAGGGATVTLHNMNDSGTKRDWKVYA